MSVSGQAAPLEARGSLPPTTGAAPLSKDGVFAARIVLLMMVIWTLLPSLLFHASPLDVIESGMWGREWIIGSHKHPALPSWFLEISRYLSGGSLGWSAYLVSALFTGASLWLTYLLVRLLIGEETAVLGMLTLATVEHFSWRSPEFNHDIAQIPFWVGVPLVAWLAVERGQILWWALLGLVGALGLYAKLSHAVILMVVFGWLLWDPKARANVFKPGPWIALVVFAIVAIPLARWLLATDFSAVAFAQERGRAARSLPEVMLNVALVVSPAVIIILAGRYWPLASQRAQPPSPDARARLYLGIMTVAPILLGIALSRAFGSSVRQDWMSPMLCLVPAFVIDRVVPPERLAGAFERGKKVGLALLIAIPVIYAVAVRLDEHMARSSILRVNWPQEEIATKLAAAWEQETHRPLKIVAGHPWLMGLVGINHPDRPSILLNGEMRLSRWVTPERLRREGALVAWQDRSTPPPALQGVLSDRPVKSLTVTLGKGSGARPITIHYVIVPPAD